MCYLQKNDEISTTREPKIQVPPPSATVFVSDDKLDIVVIVFSKTQVDISVVPGSGGEKYMIESSLTVHTYEES